MKAGNYKIEKFCMEPTSFTVKEESAFKGGEPEFVKTRLMTRLTYTLDEISGAFKVDGSGNGELEFLGVWFETRRSPRFYFFPFGGREEERSTHRLSPPLLLSLIQNVYPPRTVEFKEEDGIDYAPVTVQLPGGERVPFLFTIKELAAKGTLSAFGGDFTVPSYRGSSFLDPKGRGGSTGYDNAVALPARSDADELQKENNKSVVALRGQAVFSVAKVDPATGEIAGVFESVQPSDTDLGSKAPKDIKITGLWYGQLTQ